MKLRRILFFHFAAILFLGLSSCNKWLDVKPSDQISDEDMFSDALNVRNALNGIYQQISGPTLYGRNFTWGLNSALGQDYDGTDIAAEYQYLARLFDQGHSSAIAVQHSIWATSYNAIANCNKLIKEIEDLDPEMFPMGEVEKSLIKGEALAVRALLHFELLRLYAPSPKTEPNGTYIPYVETYPVDYTPASPTSKVIEFITRDLDLAQELIAPNDTITHRTGLAGRLQSQLTGGSSLTGGLFFNFRMNRLNFVAVHGMLARVYHYAGDRENAKKAAQYVYDNFGNNGRLRWWMFTSEGNSTGVNKYHKLVDDVIFATYDPDLIAKTESFMGTTYGYRLNTAEWGNWFPAGVRDFRSNLLRQDARNTSHRVSEKWLFNPSTAQYRPQQNTIAPVLRMSEIYYIYAETLFEEGNTTEALRVFNEIRQARGRNTTFSSTDPAEFYDELLAEYRRDFIVEGQTIFAYKRLGRDIRSGTQVIPMDERFTLTIPENERIF